MNINYFIKKQAADREFITLTEDAPAWIREAVHQAHRDELPNDWRYMVASAIWTAIVDRFDGDPNAPETTAKLAEYINWDEFDQTFAAVMDALSPCTSELYQWAAEMGRHAYVEQVEKEGMFDSARDAIYAAYHDEVQDMTNIIMDALYQERPTVV